jgi:hypothetical protein
MPGHGAGGASPSAFDLRMKEGWHNDDYLVLFEGAEIEQREQDYGLDRLLPGHRLLGLVGWDDFLVLETASQKLFRVPTVPIAPQQRKEWPHSVDVAALRPDVRFQGRIKWYLKPIVLGGDPNPGENMTWISHGDHVRAVKYWNDMYSHVVGTQ